MDPSIMQEIRKEFEESKQETPEAKQDAELKRLAELFIRRFEAVPEDQRFSNEVDNLIYNSLKNDIDSMTPEQKSFMIDLLQKEGEITPTPTFSPIPKESPGEKKETSSKKRKREFEELVEEPFGEPSEEPVEGVDFDDLDFDDVVQQPSSPDDSTKPKRESKELVEEPVEDPVQEPFEDLSDIEMESEMMAEMSRQEPEKPTPKKPKKRIPARLPVEIPKEPPRKKAKIEKSEPRKEQKQKPAPKAPKAPKPTKGALGPPLEFNFKDRTTPFCLVAHMGDLKTKVDISRFEFVQVSKNATSLLRILDRAKLNTPPAFLLPQIKDKPLYNAIISGDISNLPLDTLTDEFKNSLQTISKKLSSAIFLYSPYFVMAVRPDIRLNPERLLLLEMVHKEKELFFRVLDPLTIDGTLFVPNRPSKKF